MRRTNPPSTRRPSPVQRRLELVAATPTPRFEPNTIARYRVSLLREASTPYDRPEDCSMPEVAARFLWSQLFAWDREVCGALFLDNRSRAIGHCFAYVGTINRAAVEPRGFLVPALLSHAAALVLFHNHPSGDPTPSAEDLHFTRRMVEAGKVVGIPVVDHLILAEEPRYLSLKQKGLVGLG